MVAPVSVMTAREVADRDHRACHIRDGRVRCGGPGDAMVIGCVVVECRRVGVDGEFAAVGGRPGHVDDRVVPAGDGVSVGVTDGECFHTPCSTARLACSQATGT